MAEKRPERERLNRLRQLMKEKGINTYVITKSDPHQSEYSPAHWNGVYFISGFSGSAAVAAVTMDKAMLWTDGRYELQAEKELAGTGFAFISTADPAAKQLMDWLRDETPAGGAIGFNGLTLNACDVRLLEKATEVKNIKLKGTLELLENIWPNRPSLERFPVYPHDIKFCGEARGEKLRRLRDSMKEIGAEAYALSSLDDIAWLMNLRGQDFDTAPLFNAYAAVTLEKAALYADQSQVKSLAPALEQDGVEIRPYEDIFKLGGELGQDKSVMLSPKKTSGYLYQSLKCCRVIELEEDNTSIFKSIKNKTELDNWEQAQIRDGAAMVRFIKWMKETGCRVGLREHQVGERLIGFRREGDNYLMPSFETIAGYNENGAVIHYHAEAETSLVIKPEGMLLVDSGAHYLDGTTDITRTIILGEITDEMRRDFTLVLKAHIRLAQAVFSYGTCGTGLDSLARQPLWEKGMDYKHGTGHGVGYCLNVHEGPQTISSLANPWKLEPGMVMSNEPGLYRKGKYGVRTENLIQVIPYEETEYGTFLRFKTFTYCPVDLEGIDCALLSPEEKAWINEYHQLVYEKLEPMLDKENQQWLREQTRQL